MGSPIFPANPAMVGASKIAKSGYIFIEDFANPRDNLDRKQRMSS